MIKFLIHRPIAVLMTTLAILILGLMASGRIPISLMPDIDIPEITVQVSSDNMSAREMEDAIIRPLRSALMQVNHLDDLKSETGNGNAVIKLNFAHGTDTDYSFIEVNEKIDRAMGSLPREVDRPRVIKSSASDIPVFYLNLTLKDAEATQENGLVNQQFIDFNRFANQVVRKRIEQIPEVAMVDVNGLISPEILIEPDPEKMIALGISLQEIESAINRQDVEIGSILVKDNQYQYNLRLGSSLKSTRDLEDIYINKNNRLFQLKELAEVREQPSKRTGLVLFNDREAVSMAIIKQGDERMDALKESLNSTVSAMERDYPEISFSIVRDQTRLLDFAIGNLSQSLLWGITLAFLVMFLFLRDFRSPFLIGISVPVSLVVSLLFFHLLGISINIISLSGLILGTGLMIDNAIIVIDNITQHMEKGYSLSDACIEGTNEVSRPMLSAVLTTCAVFIPLIFLSGVAGAIFYDQAMAITIGLFVSLLVSISLLPVLYRLFHLKSRKDNAAVRYLQKINSLNYAGLYEKGFRTAMKKQPAMLMIFGLLIMLSVLSFFILPKRQMPELTTTETMLEIDWNEPLNVEENKSRILQLTNSIKPVLENYNAQVGQQQFLLDKNSRAKTSEAAVYLQAESPQALRQMKEEVKLNLQQRYPAAVMEYGEVDNIFNLIFAGNKAPLTARLHLVGVPGNDRYRELEQVWNRLQEGLPELVLPPIVWEEQIGLLADARKLNLYNISSSQLNAALEQAFNEREVLSITDNQEFVPVVIGNEEKAVNEVLQETQLRRDSSFFNASDFLTRVEMRGLQTITAGKAGEYHPIDLMITDSQEEGVTRKIREIVSEADSYDVNFTGSLFEDRELINELLIVFSITLALLYFILASQFESLTLPFIILAEIPISMAGALLLLQLFGMSLNLMSMIGIVVMSGIIINDSILKIDTIIQLQKRGYSLMRALLVAGQRRLKPILMTSITTILALFPVLLVGGMGGELQAPLAVALIGGMLVGTFVSLYFIPIFYYRLAKKKTYAHE